MDSHLLFRSQFCKVTWLVESYLSKHLCNVYLWIPVLSVKFSAALQSAFFSFGWHCWGHELPTLSLTSLHLCNKPVRFVSGSGECVGSVVQVMPFFLSFFWYSAGHSSRRCFKVYFLFHICSERNLSYFLHCVRFQSFCVLKGFFETSQRFLPFFLTDLITKY